jgi:hypothetical protein
MRSYKIIILVALGLLFQIVAKGQAVGTLQPVSTGNPKGTELNTVYGGTIFTGFTRLARTLKYWTSVDTSGAIWGDSTALGYFPMFHDGVRRHKVAYRETLDSLHDEAISHADSLFGASGAGVDTNGLSNRIDGKQNILVVTTTGNSGAATLVNDTLNIPQYTGGSSSSVDTARIYDSLAAKENVTNKATTLSSADNIKYPTTLAVLSADNTITSYVMARIHDSLNAARDSIALLSTAVNTKVDSINNYVGALPAYSITPTNTSNWTEAYNKYTVSGTYATGSITFTRKDNTTWTVTGLNTGTLSSVSIASANGFAGSSSGGATPVLTMSVTATGILKSNGAEVSAAIAGDFPTLNQNTTGSAAKLTTARSINGSAFDGTADITITAAAGTITGNTLANNVLYSSLTSLGVVASLNATVATIGTLNFTTAGSIPTLNQNTTGTANVAGGSIGAIPYQSASNTTTVLAATATANKMLLSGSSAAPTWSTSTIPSSAGTSGNIVYSDGTNYVTQAPVQTITTTNFTTSYTVNSTDMRPVHLIITAQAGNLLLNAPTGTWVDGQIFSYRIKSTGIITISYNGKFVDTDVVKPSTTTSGGTTYGQFEYNAADDTFDCVGKTKK